jgi:hypothetical protein
MGGKQGDFAQTHNCGSTSIPGKVHDRSDFHPRAALGGGTGLNAGATNFQCPSHALDQHWDIEGFGHVIEST